jgi:hypothetical protein
MPQSIGGVHRGPDEPRKAYRGLQPTDVATPLPDCSFPDGSVPAQRGLLHQQARRPASMDAIVTIPLQSGHRRAISAVAHLPTFVPPPIQRLEPNYTVDELEEEIEDV